VHSFAASVTSSGYVVPGVDFPHLSIGYFPCQSNNESL
jgi:hypothetical protein